MNSGFSGSTTPSLFRRFCTFLFGKSLPLDPKKRQHTLLIAFLAWIGLGADGLSSACYGPEQAFLILHRYPHLALYLAFAIALTVFVIALGYNQVIELFPSGGGGYKVATQLLGPFAGLISGAALIVDYVLTIAVSIASCVDAFFSMLPLSLHSYKLFSEIALLLILLILNLRGVKESIKVLMPIFLTFFISHFVLIIYGILKQSAQLPTLFADTYQETLTLTHQAGGFAIIALLLRAYSLGAGTYTGIEAVSNNINQLMPPRVKTGIWTMRYIALSLAFTAGGIILLYLLWNVSPLPGQTLNAITFKKIISEQIWFGIDFGALAFFLVMISEAGILLVAANTGYVGGPTVLANMAADSWVPLRFRHLSSRLVTQNGIVLMSIAASLILFWTKGKIELLVTMYSINVFLTFSLSLLGLCIYWIKTKHTEKNRIIRFCLSLFGFIVTASILVVTILEKFQEGGWLTLLITSLLIVICLLIKKHYTRFQLAMEKVSNHFKYSDPPPKRPSPLPLIPEQPTAIFLVGQHLGIGMSTLKTVLSLFPNQYKNFVFLSIGTIDSQNYGQDHDFEKMSLKVKRRLSYFVNYCRVRNLPAVHYYSNDTDTIEGLARLAEQKSRLYPNCVFFASTLIFEKDTWINHWLHNHTATLVQHKLHLQGLYMMLLPIHLPSLDN